MEDWKSFFQPNIRNIQILQCHLQLQGRFNILADFFPKLRFLADFLHISLREEQLGCNGQVGARSVPFGVFMGLKRQAGQLSVVCTLVFTISIYAW